MRPLQIEDAETQCGLEFHPHSLLLPLMAGAEFEELVADIRAHGLREKITLLDDKVLDGRNRFLALTRINRKVSPESYPKMFTEFPGGNPLEWVISKNLHRRHLTESQRAIIAGKLSLQAPGTRWNGGMSAPKVAAMMSVSRNSVFEAKRIIKDHPELVPQIESGKRRIGRHNVDGIIHAAIPVEEAQAFRRHCKTVGRSMASILRELICAHLGMEKPQILPKRRGGRSLNVIRAPTHEPARSAPSQQR